MSRVLLQMMLILAMMIGMAGTGMAADNKQPESWEVAVGYAVNNEFDVFTMYPKALYIHEGDTVTFTNKDIIEPHTVTFLAGSAPINPDDEKSAIPTDPSGVKWEGAKLLNSGILFPTQSYTITFTKSGAYSYYCVFHPTMVGMVVVVPKDRPIPNKVEQQAAAKHELEAMQQHAAVLKVAKNAVSSAKNPDGTTTHKVTAGTGTHDFIVNAYLPGTITIKQGDFVEWVNDSHSIQLVIFNLPKDFPLQVDGGPNEKLGEPAGGAEFDGQEYLNSGIIFDQPYKVKFLKAGTYQYSNPLFNITGTIIVTP